MRHSAGSLFHISRQENKTHPTWAWVAWRVLRLLLPDPRSAMFQFHLSCLSLYTVKSTLRIVFCFLSCVESLDPSKLPDCLLWRFCLRKAIQPPPTQELPMGLCVGIGSSQRKDHTKKTLVPRPRSASVKVKASHSPQPPMSIYIYIYIY